MRDRSPIIRSGRKDASLRYWQAPSRDRVRMIYTGKGALRLPLSEGKFVALLGNRRRFNLHSTGKMEL